MNAEINMITAIRPNDLLHFVSSPGKRHRGFKCYFLLNNILSLQN